MAIEYPSVLPIPTREAFNRSYESSNRQSKMDDGSRRTRRIFFAQAFNMSVTWKLTSEQLAIFTGFLQYDCKFGTEWFELPLIPDRAPVSVKLKGGAPQFRSSGHDWTASAQLLCIEAGAPTPAVLSMPLWPATLPLPEKDNYSIQETNMFSETSIGAGIPQSRSRFETKEQVFTVGLRLTLEERDIFWDFVRNKLLDCTMAFGMWVQNGLGMSLVRCMIASQPKETAEGACFRVDFTLATSEAPRLSYEEYIEAIGRQLVDDYAEDYFLEDYTELVPV